MAGRIIVSTTKRNPGVKKAKAAAGRAVRGGVSKGARVGAQIMARGRRPRGGPGAAQGRGPEAAAGPGREAGARAAQAVARAPGRTARGVGDLSRRRPRAPAPGRRGARVPPRHARGPGPPGAAPGPAGPRQSAAPTSPGSSTPPPNRRLRRPSVPHPRRPLIRRRGQDGDEGEGGGRRRRRLPFRRPRRGKRRGTRRGKKQKPLVYRVLNARKLRRRRRIRRLVAVAGSLVLFITIAGVFTAAGQPDGEGAGGVRVGFVSGIPYSDIFNATATLGIDPRLVAAVAFVESSFRPEVIDCRVISEDEARGIMQITPITVVELGGIDPCDPAQAIPAAARYLLAQYERFGTWELALAAYHAGPTDVATFGGVPPYPDTQKYLPDVIGKWTAYMAEFPTGTIGTEAPFGPLGSTARYTEIVNGRSLIKPSMQQFLDAVVPIFGQGHGIGCYRDQEDGEHPLGRACDFIMQWPLNHMPTQQYLEHGWAFVNYCIAHAGELKLRYIIWQKQIWQAGIGWREYTRYDPYGNLQQNHYDHVHVTVNP
jgi:hypothetical protein